MSLDVAASPHHAALRLDEAALTVAVVGLGYVGLPLAIALAKSREAPVIGFDVSRSRIAELQSGHDRTGEIEGATLRATTLKVSADPAMLDNAGIHIVTVPTPVDSANQPDLGPVRAACRTVGEALARRGRARPPAVVVFESTVYPGVTEDVCGPVIAEISGLVCGRDFFLGYSPERINPGDKVHTVDRITKVVAGQTPEVAELLGTLYGRITSGGVFLARDIKTAEAAKVIENAQRDINIAFVNEATMIFQRLGMSVHDVLDAARTKWNFLDFRPGLVGGHCIGVDPFYLAHCAQQLGHHPEIILSGRRINDGMGDWIADCIGRRAASLGLASPRTLVLGLTFKENVPDLRNSKVIDLIRGLEARGHRVDVHDTRADPAEAEHEYGVKLRADLSEGGYAVVVGAVPHDAYRNFTPAEVGRLLAEGGLLADVKGMWRSLALPPGRQRWEL
ncbi:MAG: UDP-N-acetyl-D-galactosamine dehydrogenase [Alphaproteobacteria bacterium]|nr:MAG: UDP-N-acetyl-D-galactosamine dehydrogenase [Alphaproteobacteria bacterium]